MQQKTLIHYNDFHKWIVDRAGGKIHKISLQINDTCPNRDGSKAWGGCNYCSENGSGSKNQEGEIEIEEQWRKGIAYIKRKRGIRGFIAYFQAFTSTYMPVEIFAKQIEKSLKLPGAVGFAVSTRPDCFNEEILSVIRHFGKDRIVWIELGLQSIHQRSLNWMNRQDTVEEFAKAARLITGTGIHGAAHMIYGIPGETEKDIEATRDYIYNSGLDGIKIHQLHPIPGTKLWRLYQKGGFTPVEEEKYLQFLVDSIRFAPKNIVFHRVIADHERKTYIFRDGIMQQKEDILTNLQKKLENGKFFQGDLIGI